MVNQINPFSNVPASAPLTGDSRKTGDPFAPGENSANPLDSLNLDQVSLSPQAKGQVVWARAQFEVNYHLLRSMNTANGYQTEEVIFSLQGSIEFLQKASGKTDPKKPEGSGKDGTQGPPPTDKEKALQDGLARMQEYFSPENTANRILDVAMSFFGVSEAFKKEGDTESARQTFSDFILQSIDEGFRQAGVATGPLPEEVKAGVDKTHELITTGLLDFVKNGIPREKTGETGVLEKISQYRIESQKYVAELKKSYESGGYNARGEGVEPPSGPVISTKG